MFIIFISSRIYVIFFLKVRLTDALVSSLELKKGKEAELSWLDAHITLRDQTKDAKPSEMDVDAPKSKYLFHFMISLLYSSYI